MFIFFLRDLHELSSDGNHKSFSCRLQIMTVKKCVRVPGGAVCSRLTKHQPGNARRSGKLFHIICGNREFISKPAIRIELSAGSPTNRSDVFFCFFSFPYDPRRDLRVDSAEKNPINGYLFFFFFQFFSRYRFGNGIIKTFYATAEIKQTRMNRDPAAKETTRKKKNKNTKPYCKI